MHQRSFGAAIGILGGLIGLGGAEFRLPVLLGLFTFAPLEALILNRRDSEVGEFQGWEPQPDDEAARFIEDMSDVGLFTRGAWVQLGIADQHDDELIGDVGICLSADGEKAEIGFTVAPCAQGSGPGTEAVREVIGLIFDHTDVSRSSPSSTHGTCERIDSRCVPGFRSLRASLRCFVESPALRMSGLSRGPT